MNPISNRNFLKADALRWSKQFKEAAEYYKKAAKECSGYQRRLMRQKAKEMEMKL